MIKEIKDVEKYLVDGYNAMEYKDSLVRFITVDKNPLGMIEISLFDTRPEYVNGDGDELWCNDGFVFHFKIDCNCISKDVDFSKCIFEVNND
tara:strand:- start:339 stop:614 length:276 start_codon:yes stop_codon:yes gene_type:complete